MGGQVGSRTDFSGHGVVQHGQKQQHGERGQGEMSARKGAVLKPHVVIRSQRAEENRKENADSHNAPAQFSSMHGYPCPVKEAGTGAGAASGPRGAAQRV